MAVPIEADDGGDDKYDPDETPESPENEDVDIGAGPEEDVASLFEKTETEFTEVEPPAPTQDQAPDIGQAVAEDFQKVSSGEEIIGPPQEFSEEAPQTPVEDDEGTFVPDEPPDVAGSAEAPGGLLEHFQEMAGGDDEVPAFGEDGGFDSGMIDLGEDTGGGRGEVPDDALRDLMDTDVRQRSGVNNMLTDHARRLDELYESLERVRL